MANIIVGDFDAANVPLSDSDYFYVYQPGEIGRKDRKLSYLQLKTLERVVEDYQTYIKTTVPLSGEVVKFNNICTGHVGTNTIIGDGVKAVNTLPFQEPVYIEISADLNLTTSGLGVNGNRLEVYNSDTSSHTLTLTGSISETISPKELFRCEVKNSTYILDHYTTSLSTGATYTPAHRNNILICDVSSAGFTVPINLSNSFVGQKIHVIATGTDINTVKNTGAGLYANGVYINSNTGGAFYDVIDNSGTLELRSESGISANITSGGFRILKNTNGDMELVSGSIAMATGSTVSIVENTTFPKAFSILYNAWADITKTTASKLTLPLLDENTSTVTNFIQRFSTNTGTAVNNSGEAEYRINAKGKYA